jgi:hypothetical protein
VPPSFIELIALVRNDPRFAMEGPARSEGAGHRRVSSRWRPDAAVDFWTDVVAKAGASAEPKVAEG